MKKLFYILTILLCSTSVLVLAQTDAESDAVSRTVDYILAEERKIIPDYVQLTEAEAQAFWPIYDDYQNTLRKFLPKIVVLINKYVNLYRTMTDGIDRWWNGDHSWSGNAANLHMVVERGGCFCERLPDGGVVEHLRLIYVAPGSELRFDGALGPLQTMAVQGRMIWKIEPAEHGSKITFTYHVHGHPAGGLANIAPAVDGVIGEQLTRLGQRLEQ